jgi:hypothetical protein
MTKRILLLTTLAALMAAAMALSGVAQAQQPIGGSADAQCARLAIETLGPSYNPSNYTFVGGTEGDDFSLEATDGPDVFCGFGGADGIFLLDTGDVFLGGTGNDNVYINYGTFYGGAGDDYVSENSGTFYGGAGDDSVSQNSGTFRGGTGNDAVTFINYGTFYGGAGDDNVYRNFGTFYGGPGYDTVAIADPPVDGP